jgi:methyl-accepting chemotaxis protein
MTTRFALDSIATRIGMAVGAMLLGLLAVTGTGVYGLAQLDQRIAELVNITTVKSDAASQMRLDIVSRVDAVRNIALTADVNAMQADQKRIDGLVAAYAAGRQTLTALPLTDSEKAALAQADAAEAKAAPVLKQAQALARMMQPEMAAETLVVKLAPVQKDWIVALEALSASAEAGRTEVLAATQASRQQTLIWMCGTGAAALAIGVTLAILLARGISQRLRQAVNVTQSVADGDLSSHVDVADRSDGDEVAQTLSALGLMQRRLRGTIGAVQHAALAIETAAGEIASGTNDLASRTEQGASSLQQTASAMEQLTGTVTSAADNASVASKLATSASAVAQRGGAVVMQVVQTMEEISASSRKIGEIIGVIDGIAFQTNILALNAAVEAARAGEQGRGFAVVAGEVRSLAHRSAQAAREIKVLIGASVEKVETGTRLADQAGATMTEIVASVSHVSAVIAEISNAAGQQTTGISEIGSAIHQLDHMTQQNAALVEQSAAAAESMREQSVRLAQAISIFRLNDEHAAAVAA